MSKYINKFRKNIKIRIAQTLLKFENISLNQMEIWQILTKKPLNQNIREDELIIINNLRETLAFIDGQNLNELIINHDLFIKLNSMLAKDQALFVGNYRNKYVHIQCISEPIAIPNINRIESIFKDLNNINSNNFQEVAANSFCKLAKMQVFFDGNKRSALLLCNLALFKKNLGFLSINSDDYLQFEKFLTQYYQGDEENLSSFMKNNIRKIN